MIEETLNHIKQNYENYNICILGTTGTIKSKVYHEHFLSNDIKYIYLNNYDQDIIMNVINDTKADKNRENIKNNLLSVVKNVQNNIKIIKKYTVECTFFAVFYSSNLHLCAMISEVYCADFA
jgi:aspartate/glutamate racemase